MTVLPKAWFPEAQLDHKTVLTAVNKSRISTYGQKAIQFRFGRNTYKFTTIIGDIATPVIGWDMIQKFKLSIVWYGNNCALRDARYQTETKLRVEAVSDKDSLHLAKLDHESFKNWSARHTQEANKEAKIKSKPIPTKYQALIDQFPDLTKYDFKAK